jgi:hypothetical protein
MAKGRQAQETAETMRPMPRPNTKRPMPRPKRMFERQQDAYGAAMEIYEKNMQKFKDADPTRFDK